MSTTSIFQAAPQERGGSELAGKHHAALGRIKEIKDLQLPASLSAPFPQGVVLKARGKWQRGKGTMAPGQATPASLPPLRSLTPYPPGVMGEGGFERPPKVGVQTRLSGVSQRGFFERK